MPLDFFQAWYNFVKPRKSLRLRVDQDRKKWQRTPAMAEELTDHIWNIKELMTSGYLFNDLSTRPTIEASLSAFPEIP